MSLVVVLGLVTAVHMTIDGLSHVRPAIVGPASVLGLAGALVGSIAPKNIDPNLIMNPGKIIDV